MRYLILKANREGYGCDCEHRWDHIEPKSCPTCASTSAEFSVGSSFNGYALPASEVLKALIRSHRHHAFHSTPKVCTNGSLNLLPLRQTPIRSPYTFTIHPSSISNSCNADQHIIWLNHHHQYHHQHRLGSISSHNPYHHRNTLS